MQSVISNQSCCALKCRSQLRAWLCKKQHLFRLSTINVCDHDLGAVLSEQLGCRSSHTLAGTSDNGDLHASRALTPHCVEQWCCFTSKAATSPTCPASIGVVACVHCFSTLVAFSCPLLLDAKCPASTWIRPRSLVTLA